MLRHSTGSIQQLVHTFPFGQPRPFYIRVFILLTFFTLTHHGTAKSFLGHIESAELATIGDHITIQFQVVHLRISPHQPGLSVIVNQHRGIDMVP